MKRASEVIEGMKIKQGEHASGCTALYGGPCDCKAGVEDLLRLRDRIMILESRVLQLLDERDSVRKRLDRLEGK